MIRIPRINKMRFFHLNVGQAKFRDLTLDCQGLNTYFLAGNYTGKSSIIGFILNTLSPYRNHFIRGDSIEKRYLKDYVQKDRPGAIILEWVKDTHPEAAPRYLIVGQIVILKNDTLHQFFFIKEFIDPKYSYLDQFPFTHDEVYNTYSEIRKNLRNEDFKIIENKNEWIEELEKHYIDNRLVQRLIKMNDKESSAKEGITFRTKREFISYIIEDIIPKPSHAEELIKGLKREYTLLQEIPKYNTIIDFLKSVKQCMEKYESLYHELQLLVQDLKNLLDTWSTLTIKITQYLQILKNNLTHINSEEQTKDNDLQNLEENIQDLQIELDTTSLCYYQKKYQTQNMRYKQILELKKEKSKFQVFFNLYQHLYELKLIKNQLKDIELRMNEKLGPLHIELEKRKSDFKQILTQTYRYNLFSWKQTEKECEIKNRERDELVRTKGELESKIKERSVNREKLIQKVTNYEDKISFFIKQFKDKVSFEKIRDYIELQLEKTKANIQKVEKQTQILEKQNIQLIEQEKELKKHANILSQELEKNNTKLKKIETKWEELIQLQGFIIQFGSISNIKPLYHYMSKERQNSLEIKIDEFQRSEIKLRSELDLLVPKIEHYRINNSFPPSHKIEELISWLETNGIKAYEGWKYYSANQDVIDQTWLQEFPHLFEGIIISGAEINQILPILSEKDIETEFPLFITRSTLFMKKSMDTNIADYSIYVDKSIQWKYDPTYKEIYYNTLTNRKQEIESTITGLDLEITHLKELRNKTQEFLQIANEKTYNQIHKSIHDTQSILKSIQEEIIQKSALFQQNKNRISILEEELEKEKSNQESWVEKEKEAQNIQIYHSQLPGLKQEIQEYTKSISTNKSTLRIIENETLPIVESQLKALNQDLKQSEKKKILNLHEFRQFFQEVPLKIESKEQPQKSVEEVKKRYLDFKTTVETNPDIVELERQISYIKEDFTQKDEYINSKCKEKQITQQTIYELWNEYQNLSSEIPKLTRQNQEELNSLIKQETELEISRKKTEKKIKELEEKITEDVPPSTLSLKHLKQQIDDKKNNLEYHQNEKEILESALKTLLEEKALTSNLIGNLTRFKKTVESDSDIFVNIYEKLKEPYTSAVEITSIENHTLETIQKEANDLIQSESDLNQLKVEISQRNLEYEKQKRKFQGQLQEIIQNADKNKFLKDYEVTGFLQNLKIEQILRMKEECENDIQEKENELSSRKRRLDIQVKYFFTELRKCFDQIFQFQNTKITIRDKYAFTNQRPIRIKFTFEPRDLNELLESYLSTILTSFSTDQPFPQEWCEYETLIQSMISEFLEGRIREIHFLLPHGTQKQYSNFNQIMRMSGGQTATIAIILYCYIAHYKIKNKRRLDYENQELMEKIPITIPYIADNPMGNANKEELVRLQLDVAKSLNVQLLYFSGIEEAHNIEEFDSKIKIIKTADLSVMVGESDSNVILKGPSLYHTPLRKEMIED